jgi:hypothetical protein
MGIRSRYVRQSIGQVELLVYAPKGSQGIKAGAEQPVG